MKNKKGITLIALVITIIVLLILAGVALATLTGNTSIIDNANYAVQEYNKSTASDQNVITSVEDLFAKYMGGEQNNSGDDDNPAVGDDDDDDIPLDPRQREYGNILTAQDEINQYLFTYSTTAPTTQGENGTAVVTGINWQYFVDDDFVIASSQVSNGITKYEFSVLTEDKKYEVASTLRKLIVPYEITIDNQKYDVTSIAMHEEICFTGYTLDNFRYYDFDYDYYLPALATGSYYWDSPYYAEDEDESYLIIPASVETISGIGFLPRNNIIFAENSKVREIPAYFYNDLAATNIVLPRTLNSIGVGAFQYTAIESITIPEGVDSIESETFTGCSALTTVNLPTTLRSIGSNAFGYCNSLEYLYIPDGVVSIEGGWSNTPLTSIRLPNTLTTISEGAFYGSSLESIVIPEGVTEIEDYAFDYCPYLTTVSFPSTLTSIGYNAFFGCPIEVLDIPDSVTTIGYSAFSANESLTTLKLPANLETLDYSAFDSSAPIQTITYKGTTYTHIEPLKAALKAGGIDEEKVEDVFGGITLQDD